MSASNKLLCFKPMMFVGNSEELNDEIAYRIGRVLGTKCKDGGFG